MTARLPSSDLEWCHDAVQDVSRTFALTVDVLEEPMSSQICLGYLLCRVADTIEDASHLPPAEQVALLDRYDAALSSDTDVTMAQFRSEVDEWLPSPAERNADWSVVANVPTVWATFEERPEAVRCAVVPPVREMVTGMGQFIERYEDAGGLRIADRAELESYCHYAAGTVGTLITNLLTRGDVGQDRSRQLYDTAGAFGLLLQLVNVSKDVYADFHEENNVYLPAEWLDAAGVEQDAVLDPDNRDAVATVVDRTAAFAQTFLDDAQSYLETAPMAFGNTIAAWSIPYLLSVGTLRELRDRPKDALTDGGVKVSRQEVLAVVHAANGTSPAGLSDLRETIAREPFHLASTYR
ncbi:phytoene/squalene synthase family protein [Salinarchaeum sp. Harcht-Bsk1]|uniref:phytoene/squalene synthase family protein n=1 Tax=Salinarchaeum sp. Harcht-Bsk1 TaxID=1333523 RepID=UPI00067826CA|nr:phytoene/squalene synthase family protein [Salinarchaeum sp. Harcht-Bsk1]